MIRKIFIISTNGALWLFEPHGWACNLSLSRYDFSEFILKNKQRVSQEQVGSSGAWKTKWRVISLACVPPRFFLVLLLLRILHGWVVLLLYFSQMPKVIFAYPLPRVGSSASCTLACPLPFLCCTSRPAYPVFLWPCSHSPCWPVPI